MTEYKSYVPAHASATTYADAPIDDVRPHDWWGRYGYSDVTFESRKAGCLATVMAAVAATLMDSATMLSAWAVWYVWQPDAALWKLIGAILAAVFAYSFGSFYFWRNRLETWSIMHDRRAWDALSATVETLKRELTAARTEAAQAATEARQAYATLERDYRQALATVDGLRNELKGTGQRNASRVQKETPMQVAARAIAQAFTLGTSYSRDAICADGRVEQTAWREAMDALARHGYATQARKGGPWKIVAPTVDALLAAVGLPPAVPPTPTPEP